MGFFEGCDFRNYEASTHGKIKSIKYDKYMKYNESLKYLTIMLYDSITGKGIRIYIHRLVAHVFANGRTEEKNVVNHKDEDKKNNHYKNLEWTTSRDNTVHSIGRKVRQIDKKTGKVIKIHISINDAAESIGHLKQASCLVNCCKKNRKTAYGFIWEYAD